MARPVYFDTSVFLDLFARSSSRKADISALLRELKDGKVTIYTSIISVSEVCVLTYRRGQVAHDNYAQIGHKLA